MITLTFEKNDELLLGVKTEKGILDVKAALKVFLDTTAPTSVSEMIEKGCEGQAKLQALVERAISEGVPLLEEKELHFGPCVPNPSKIICVGLNYKKHADECNLDYPPEPLLFSKFANSLAGQGEEIPLPAVSKQVDYEAELCLVIGKKGRNIKKEEALDYVYGYCTANDVSARDLQFKSSQWLLGKTCDKFSPIGPYLVSAEEINNPQNLRVQTWVNGEKRQNSNTEDMIFHCDEIISYISAHMTLHSGDIILTGTPEGVINGYPEGDRLWLKKGDVVTVEIEKLGSLTNYFV
ncbi:fumarylacetoacetate hydrolase family protein [Priestia aryabhattai]|uniref:fumarylacetoacetate hydrolase family protein n=1 Tax=Priestia aryabhattai TaxID=412384 RepID=UPI001C0CA624|nr:fumarylacetoacetate hydrolase family protein [Priestia aryabhattai]MBU3569943.1 fumarylacetoacetate hydrolase family protein [Priestia aryabhattai]WDL87743.1 fumarylacetoacetate hydrolase family protein [Priestia aryabhattai]